MGSEDIANLADSISVPVCFWSYGGTDPNLYDDIEKRDKLDEELPGTTQTYRTMSDLMLTSRLRHTQCFLRTRHPANIKNCHGCICSGRIDFTCLIRDEDDW